ncbi:hypothetical protein [Nitrospirillum iridis]|uniref:Uncharacterized protein n=1 Tax=Nitrospirillum iridis TaxID=765888 RepID=A0A7X0B0G1_9PROT|nr:hypothetical protein [Nitrospirillum iridis]MBB6251904.1 hypothetical protein [Nitrospirillum iridis]
MESTVLLGGLSGILSAYSLSQGQLGWPMLLALKQKLDRGALSNGTVLGKANAFRETRAGAPS